MNFCHHIQNFKFEFQSVLLHRQAAERESARLRRLRNNHRRNSTHQSAQSRRNTNQAAPRTNPFNRVNRSRVIEGK